MDTVTHGLFGFTLYKVINKKDLDKPVRRGLLFAALVGSEIPDIDVVAGLTEQGQIMQQMWHRGITHSLFLVPFWALLIYVIAYLLFKVKDIRILYTAGIAVFVHNTLDLFNAWGTGYLEPFSSVRLTIGTLSIIDFVFWAIFLIGLLIVWLRKNMDSTRVFRMVALAMFLHFSIQSSQGLWLEAQAKEQYDQTELVATFVPWHFQIVGKKGERVEITQQSLFTEPKVVKTFISKDQSDLTPLFAQNPRAEVLAQWSPFVVVIDDEKRLGIADPRFYRGGGFMLEEYIEKK